MPSKIKKRGKNSYLLTVTDGYDATGKQKEFTTTVTAANITEARDLYDLFKSECVQGKVLPAGTDRMTLSQFYDYWKVKFATNHYAKTTLTSYENMFIRIKASLGHLRIDKIKPIHLVDFFAQISLPDAKRIINHLRPEVLPSIVNSYTFFFLLLLNGNLSLPTRWINWTSPAPNVNVNQYPHRSS